MRRLDIEVELAALAHRIVTHQQLRQQGLSTRQIEYRASRKILHRLIPGVYSRVPPSNDMIDRATAVCLRCPGAFLSGPAASRYWELRRSMFDHLEFTVPYGARPKRIEFAQFRFAREVCESDLFFAPDGLRVSGAARCIFEEAGRLDHAGLESMVHDGLHRGLFTMDGLREVGSRMAHRGRRGTVVFRAVVGSGGFDVPVHSEQELMLLDALRRAGIDDAAQQHPVRLANGYTVHVDVGVPSALVALEVDGPTHDDRIAVHRDKARDLQLAIQGWHVLRVTADEVQQRLQALVPGLVHVCRTRQRLLATAS